MLSFTHDVKIAGKKGKPFIFPWVILKKQNNWHT